MDSGIRPVVSPAAPPTGASERPRVELPLLQYGLRPEGPSYHASHAETSKSHNAPHAEAFTEEFEGAGTFTENPGHA